MLDRVPQSSRTEIFIKDDAGCICSVMSRGWERGRVEFFFRLESYIRH